jgi:hypothetical protein
MHHDNEPEIIMEVVSINSRVFKNETSSYSKISSSYFIFNMIRVCQKDLSILLIKLNLRLQMNIQEIYSLLHFSDN